MIQTFDQHRLSQEDDAELGHRPLRCAFPAPGRRCVTLNLNLEHCDVVPSGFDFPTVVGINLTSFCFCPALSLARGRCEVAASPPPYSFPAPGRRCVTIKHTLVIRARD